MVAPSHGLWISNKGSKFSNVANINKNDSINSDIVRDSKNNVWMAADEENFVYETKNMTSFQKIYLPKNGTNQSYITSLAKDNSGNPWLLSDNYVYRLVNNKFEIVDQGKISGAITIYFDNNNNIWIGTFNALWKSTDNGKTFTKIQINKLYWGGAYKIFVDKNKNIWISDSESQKIWKSTDNGKTFELMKSIFNLSVDRIFQDKNNDIWFETYGQGIWKSSDGTNFVQVGKNITDVNNQFLYFDNIGNPWIYTYENGLYKSMDGTNFGSVGSFKNISLIFEDNNNDMWVSTHDNGLWEITN